MQAPIARHGAQAALRIRSYGRLLMSGVRQASCGLRPFPPCRTACTSENQTESLRDHLSAMMKSSLDHLPPQKQRELTRVLEILHEEFEDALKGSSAEWKKRGRILKVILFGSYARGSWVDEPHTTKGYRSDFDLLIIVNNKKLCEFEPYWHKAADRFLHDRAIKTPVSFIVHSRREVNDAIRKGQYFFTDIRREGIALYELDDESLTEPRPRSPKEAYETASEEFDDRLPFARSMMKSFQLHLDDNELRQAAFFAPPSHRAGLLCAAAHTHQLCSAFTQHQVPALAGRGTGAQPDRRLAARAGNAPGVVQHAGRSLREGALFQALPHRAGGAAVAGRRHAASSQAGGSHLPEASRQARPQRRQGLRRPRLWTGPAGLTRAPGGRKFELPLRNPRRMEQPPQGRQH